MPWLITPGALRRLRRAHKLDRAEAANATGLRQHTIRLHEGPKPPRCLSLDSVERYEKAYKVERAEFVKWEDHGVRRDDDQDDGAGDPLAAPPGTLEARAQRERESQDGELMLAFASGTYEHLGPKKIRRAQTACLDQQDQRFAIVKAKISNQDYIPEVAARALGAEVGAGGMFKVEWRTNGIPAYVTVFTKQLDHTRYMLNQADARKRVSVIVRCFV